MKLRVGQHLIAELVTGAKIKLASRWNIWMQLQRVAKRILLGPQYFCSEKKALLALHRLLQLQLSLDGV